MSLTTGEHVSTGFLSCNFQCVTDNRCFRRVNCVNGTVTLWDVVCSSRFPYILFLLRVYVIVIFTSNSPSIFRKVHFVLIFETIVTYSIVFMAHPKLVCGGVFAYEVSSLQSFPFQWSTESMENILLQLDFFFLISWWSFCISLWWFLLKALLFMPL